MSVPIWTLEQICAATGGSLEGPGGIAVTGISIDTRTLSPGDLFVPLRDKRDGHEFVETALALGASAALVAKDYKRLGGNANLIRVADPLHALEALARLARERLPPSTAVVAVTGSVGKTGTKDMLRQAFASLGSVHAADKSFNNHWGVPLSLARTPKDVDAAIFEIGMNHAGEISPLAQMVRPQAAIITTVAPVHLEFFKSVADIAEAKAEIFDGFDEGGLAILNSDNAYFPILRRRAEARGAKIKTFGKSADADVCLVGMTQRDVETEVLVSIEGRKLSYALAMSGEHVALNSLAVVAALQFTGRNVHEAVASLAGLASGAGRGAREQIAVPGGTMLVIDESYNANPASMGAALRVLGTIPRDAYKRRVAILGDMLELGHTSRELHRSLRDAIDHSDIDVVYAAGENMSALFEDLPKCKQGGWGVDAKALVPQVLVGLEAGDAVMIKGSLGSRMVEVLAAIRTRFAT